MLLPIEISRREANRHLDPAKRSELGQYMTPHKIARFMASLFSAPTAGETISLLDAGAGVGSLSAAVLDQWLDAPAGLGEVVLTAYEVDKTMLAYLKETIERYKHIYASQNRRLITEVRHHDFIEHYILRQFSDPSSGSFDYAVLNPPYKKIGSHSRHRLLLRTAGIETVNLYTAFVALAIQALKPGGELVAIIPRSFCNGPYYKPFRRFLLHKTRIVQIHLFKSRDKAFGEDGVLQENLILHLQKGSQQADVILSGSTDGTFVDYYTQTVPFSRIVLPDDAELFIHVPDLTLAGPPELPATCFHSLASLGIEVSTGPVVDFRVKDFLKKEPAPDTVPLIYPGHYGEPYFTWPKPAFKKHNGLLLTHETAKQLFPAGYYTLVKRFSAKEEKKRIKAAVVPPTVAAHGRVGFENHLNVFHTNKTGLSMFLALGLAAYLNSTVVDQYFRQFNGHTQVNATDLRGLTYPSRTQLELLGRWALDHTGYNQTDLDRQILSL